MEFVLLIVVPILFLGVFIVIPLIGVGFLIGSMIKYWWLAGPLILLGFICSKIEE